MKKRARRSRTDRERLDWLITNLRITKGGNMRFPLVKWLSCHDVKWSIDAAMDAESRRGKA